jgi:hypothetical protein
VQNFASGDSILLQDLAPTGLTPVYNAATGILQVSNGVTDLASLMFQTSSLGAGTFHIMNSDGFVLLTHS